MNNWRKLAWEVTKEGPPDVGDRVELHAKSDPTWISHGVVESIRFNRLMGANTYHIRTDEGDTLIAFESEVRHASLWEVSPYKFQVGQQVRVKDPVEGIYTAIIDQAARDASAVFYVVRDEMGDLHVVGNERDIEAVEEGDSNELARSV
jgi:hypothetical protein